MGFIYKIELPHSWVYIGQSKNDDMSRFYQHFHSAYTHERTIELSKKEIGSNIEGLYDQMSRVRLMDIKITVYPASSGYGISNLTEAYETFSKDWTPVGQRKTANESDKTSDEGKLLDFAEIFHIMKAVDRGEKLLNNEMGGQISGYTYAVKDTVNGKGQPLKFLMSTYRPEQAYKIFHQPVNKMTIALEMVHKMLQITFSNNFKEEVMKSFTDLGVGYDSKDIASLKDEKGMQSWPEFWQVAIQHFINITFQEIANRGQIGSKMAEKQLKDVKNVVSEQMNKYIQDNFLRPKSRLCRKILRLWLQDSEINGMIDTNEDIKLLPVADYFVKALLKMITTYTSQFATINGLSLNNAKSQKHLESLKKMSCPVNMTVGWEHFGWNNSKKQEAAWLRDYQISTGTELTREEKISYSLNIFNYAFNKVSGLSYTYKTSKEGKRQRQYKRSQYNSLESYAEENNVVRSWRDIPSDEKLSAKMRIWYEKNAKGYTKKWYEFYRPMVSYWRIYKKGRDPLESLGRQNIRVNLDRISVNDSIWVSQVRDLTIWYAISENRIENSGTIDRIFVY